VDSREATSVIAGFTMNLVIEQGSRYSKETRENTREILRVLKAAYLYSEVADHAGAA
jgi:hypothetical protein